MDWQKILKKKRRYEEEDPTKKYGFTSYAGAGEAARKKREAILNNPQMKINRLKKKAEELIKIGEEYIKSQEEYLDNELEYFSTEMEGMDFYDSRDVVSRLYNTIEKIEKRRAYIQFLEDNIKNKTWDNLRFVRQGSSMFKPFYEIMSHLGGRDGDSAEDARYVFGNYSRTAMETLQRKLKEIGFTNEEILDRYR